MDSCEHVRDRIGLEFACPLQYLETLGILEAVRDALKGHVDLLLLSALEDEPAHGYELVETLRKKSEGAFDLAEGTVYPSLYRLERRGLIASGWQTVAGRRRRVYRLTKSGSGRLQKERTEWRAFTRAMEAVVT